MPWLLLDSMNSNDMPYTQIMLTHENGVVYDCTLLPKHRHRLAQAPALGAVPNLCSDQQGEVGELLYM